MLAPAPPRGATPPGTAAFAARRFLCAHGGALAMRASLRTDLPPGAGASDRVEDLVHHRPCAHAVGLSHLAQCLSRTALVSVMRAPRDLVADSTDAVTTGPEPAHDPLAERRSPRSRLVPGRRRRPRPSPHRGRSMRSAAPRSTAARPPEQQAARPSSLGHHAASARGPRIARPLDGSAIAATATSTQVGVANFSATAADRSRPRRSRPAPASGGHPPRGLRSRRPGRRGDPVAVSARSGAALSPRTIEVSDASFSRSPTICVNRPRDGMTSLRGSCRQANTTNPGARPWEHKQADGHLGSALQVTLGAVRRQRSQLVDHHHVQRLLRRRRV